MDRDQGGANNMYGYQGAPSTPGGAPYPQATYPAAPAAPPYPQQGAPQYQPQGPPQGAPQAPPLAPQGAPYQGAQAPSAVYPQRAPYPQQPSVPYPQQGTVYPVAPTAPVAPQGTIYPNASQGGQGQIPAAAPYGATNAIPYPQAPAYTHQPSGMPYQASQTAQIPQAPPQPYPQRAPYPQTPQVQQINYAQPAQPAQLPYGVQGHSPTPPPIPQPPQAPPQAAPIPLTPTLPDHSNIIPQNITVESMSTFLNVPAPQTPLQPVPPPQTQAPQMPYTVQAVAPNAPPLPHTQAPYQPQRPQTPQTPPVVPSVAQAAQSQLKVASTNPEDWRAWLGDGYVQKRGVEVMQAVIADLKQGKRIDMPAILRMIEDFVVSCKRNEEHFVTLARVKDEENYSFHHPVNVAIYSISIGSVMQYNNKQLSRLGLSALLHDIGEIKLPVRMLNKAAKFTEAELASMQKHPAYGYEILKKDPTIPEDVLLGVFHHHERLDGSGYPSGHFGRFIHPLGKIIALAETFDAMTSNRASASGMLPTDALKTLYGLAGKHYEPNAVKALIMLLGMYPMGSLVRLNTSELAVVFTKNKEDLSKPNIIMITDRNGQPTEPFIVNLYKDKGDRKIIICENAQNLQIDTNKYIQNFLVAQQKG